MNLNLPTSRLLLACLFLAAPCSRVCAQVNVIVGPTPIVKGDAKAAGDITVVNEKLAFSLAVESAVPYGVPRGALVDLAPVTDGKIGRDRVVFADFIPNNWSAWPNTYQRVEIVERGPARVVVRTARDWGAVTLVTTYTLESNSDHIVIQTTMTNGGPVELADLLSGLTLWPNSGFLFGADPVLAHRVVAYDEHWVVALHADYFDAVGDGSRDLYRRHTLGPGQSRVFEGWLQVLATGDLAPVARAEIERRHLTAGSVQGVVRDGGDRIIDAPVIVVESHDKPYAWAVGRAGHFDITLPVGDYTLYATAKNYSQSRTHAVRVAAAAVQRADFRDLAGPGSLEVGVSDGRNGQPLDARVAIVRGQTPVVEYLGRRSFFTELERKGHATIPIAPGRYVLAVSSGGGFLGPTSTTSIQVPPNATTPLTVQLTRLFEPPLRGWYSADLHHHADQAEAVTPPADLARAQLAAGLDMIFVSDHDSTVNHPALQDIADRRGVAFMPGVELSPSWGHFNAYPVSLGQAVAVDTSVATVEQIIAEARRLGALVVQVNHPFIPYGYLTSVAAGVAPGGFNPAFDLLEINASVPADDVKVVRTLWALWNAGHRYYLSAGTDTHDAWNEESGRVRMFAHVDGPLSAGAFANALKAGHGYVTHGPLIFPDAMFGDELRVTPDRRFNLGFDLESVTGLKGVQLIGAGAVLVDKAFSNAPREVHVDFPLQTHAATWYALVVEDAAGNKAYTNPIWVDAVRLAENGSVGGVEIVVGGIGHSYLSP